MIYACIDGVDDATLAFIGYECVVEGEEFAIYRHYYTGTEQIVSKHGKRYLHLEDPNDAMWLNIRHAVEFPDSNN